MNKLITKIVGAALGLTMAVGVGVAIGASRKDAVPVRAAETVFYTLDGTTTASGSSYAGDNVVTQDDVSWVVNGNVSMNPWRIGGKKSNNVTTYDRLVKSTDTVGTDENVTKVELVVGAASSITVNSLTLDAGSTAGGNDYGTVSGTFSENSTITFERPSDKDWTGRYFTLTFNVTIEVTNNKFVEFKALKFYYDAVTPATGVSLSSANFTPENNVITVAKDSSDDSDTLTATVTPADAPQVVTWTSSDENVAVVVDGQVAIDTSAVGETTITATASTGSPAPTATMKYVVEDTSAQEFDITTTVSNGTYSGATTIRENASATVTIAATGDYKLPASVTVTNATLTSYDSSTGEIVISNPNDDVIISVDCVALQSYSITVTASNCTYSGVSTILESRTATITFAVSSGYTLPSDVTVTGATKSYDSSTGVLTLSNPTANVTVSATATTYINNSGLNPGKYFISYDGHYFTGIISSGKGSSSETKPSSNASKFTFALVGNDTWTLQNDDGNYLTIGSSSTSLGLSSNLTNLTVEAGSTTGTYKIRVSGGRYMAYYSSGSDFRTYNSGQSGAYYDFTLETAKDISGFSVYSTGANKNVLKGSTFDADAAATAGFQARLNYTDSTYDDVTSLATWNLDTSTVGTAILTVTYSTYDSVVFNDMVIYVITMHHLVINSSSAKTTGYYVGDTLNTDGIVVTGVDDENNEYPIGLENVTFSPTSLGTAGSQTITVTFVNDDDSKAIGTYTVTVSTFSGYMQVTSAEGLVAGDRYVLGFEGETVLMGSYWSDKSVRYVVTDVTFSAGGKGVTESEVSSTGAHIITLIGDGTGKFYIYDIADAKFLKGSSSAADTTNVDLADATPWTISFTDGEMSILGDSRYLEYNHSSPRVGCYTNHGTSAYPSPILYRLSGSSLKDDLNIFKNDSLKMNSYDVGGKHGSTDGEGYCTSYYLPAKAAFNNLSAAEQQLFKTSSEYSAAKQRYEDWATANHDGAPYDGNDDIQTQLSAKILSNIISNSSNTYAIIIVVSLVSLTAIGAYFFIRKRKEQ